ncbi:MAG: AarF/UbiB family protein [Candidatus Endonucleobacter bathymodioli]|uniref:AarF/UbiB family protein n=1 Tax=Candidatus Endonucleibacter bathymodioli TaxID=539814 RepID=A0AA90NW08_9GAMM|nr:AarF/UbiB family protein [Candidatus Endonucleobacter bathymodioli]
MRFSVLRNIFNASNNSVDMCVHTDNSVVQIGMHENESELNKSVISPTMMSSKGVGERCIKTHNRSSFPSSNSGQPQEESYDSVLSCNYGIRKGEKYLQDPAYMDESKYLNQTVELMGSVDEDFSKNNNVLKRKIGFSNNNDDDCDYMHKKQKITVVNAVIKSENEYKIDIQSDKDDKPFSVLRKVTQCGVSMVKSIYPDASYFMPLAATWVESLLDGRWKPELKDMAKYINDCGPFVRKIGQLFASDVRIPMEKRKSLLYLCDNNLPEQFEYIKQKINDDGKKLGLNIIYIDPTPLGVGVTAQVHKVKIEVEGRIEERAVKIVRKNIRDDLSADYKEVVFSLSKLHYVFKHGIGSALESFFGFYDYHDKFEGSLTKEIMDQLLVNLINESNMINELKMMRLYKISVDSLGDGKFKVPEGICATDDMLVMEYINGDTVSKLLANGSYKKANTAYSASCKIWKDVLKNSGLMHGDLHPGNLMIEKNNNGGKIVFLDFGAIVENCSSLGDIGLFLQLLKEWLVLEQSEGFVCCDNGFHRMRYIENQKAPRERIAARELIAQQFNNRNDAQSFNVLLDSLYEKSRGKDRSNIVRTMTDLYKTCFKHDPSKSEEELENNFISQLAEITVSEYSGIIKDSMGMGKDFSGKEDLSEKLLERFIYKLSINCVKIPVELCYYLQCNARICEFESQEIAAVAKKLNNKANVVEHKSKEDLVSSESKKVTLPIKVNENSIKSGERMAQWFSMPPLSDMSASPEEIRKLVAAAREKHLPKGSLLSDNTAWAMEYGKCTEKYTPAYLKSKSPDDPVIFANKPENSTGTVVGVGKNKFSSINVHELGPRQLCQMIDGIQSEQNNNNFSSGTRYKFLEWWGIDCDRRGMRKVYTESGICSLYLDYLRGVYDHSVRRHKTELDIMHVYSTNRAEKIAAFRMGLQ